MPQQTGGSSLAAVLFTLVALWVAYFFRDIDSFVQTVRETAPFTGNSLGLPDSVAIAACGVQFPATCGPGFDWQFNQPRNTPGGPLQGWEISLQLPFYFLPGVWSNFGVLANYTTVESDVDYVNSTGAVVLTGPLVGLSEQSYNATLYYEDDRFSARVSAAYRSDYPTTLPGRNGNATEETAETLNIDTNLRTVQVSVWFDEAQAGNFDLTISAIVSTLIDPSDYFSAWYGKDGPQNYSKWEHKGFQALFSYTLGDAKDNTSIFWVWDDTLNWNPMGTDYRHVANVSWIYEMPFGHGRAFLSNAPKALDFVAGGLYLKQHYGLDRQVTHIGSPDQSKLNAVAVSRDGKWVAAGGRGLRQLDLGELLLGEVQREHEEDDEVEHDVDHRRHVQHRLVGLGQGDRHARVPGGLLRGQRFLKRAIMSSRIPAKSTAIRMPLLRKNW